MAKRSRLRPAQKRLAVAAVLLLCCGAVLAQPAPEPFVPLAQSTCIICHATWLPPLKEMVRVRPPALAGAPLGQDFEYTVQFQLAWTPTVGAPEFLFVNPVLDLTKAPSLRFGGAREPVRGNVTHHSLIIDPLRLDDAQENLTRIHVGPGATALSWRLVPKNQGATGPDLALLLQAPGSNKTLVVDSNHSAGSTEEHHLQLKDLEGLRGEEWTVGARVQPLPLGPWVPQPDRVDFDIVWDGDFDAGLLRSMSYPKDTVVAGGGSYLQTWKLRFMQNPVEKEHVAIRFDSTPYFDHGTQPASADIDNLLGEAVLVNVTLAETPQLTFVSSSTPPARPVNGPTVTRVSEAVGYASALLFVSSILSGGMFGQASRRALNSVFQTARRRVAFHNFLSYGLTVAAIVHTILFILPMVPGDGGLHRPTEEFQWTSFPAWKWWHYGLTVAAILFTLAHMVLDGQNFGTVVPELQQAVPDPFHDPLTGQTARPSLP